MNRFAKISLMLTVVLLVGASIAQAQTPTHIEYAFDGTGNFMVSPVQYSGTIISGEPTLVGGTWTLNVDDTGWPPDTDKLVRWNYIDATYFSPNYDNVYYTWTGVFDENSTASQPTWTSGHTLGTLSGTAALQITISDFDLDGVIDTDERGFWNFSGTLIVVKNGTGIFAGYCGLGSFSGYTTNPDPANWADDVIGNGYTVLDIEDCSIPTEDITWGQVKKLYEK
jgi:hypothetical protein